MGTGIAMALASAGVETWLMDEAAGSLERASRTIRSTFESQKTKGRINAEEAAARIGRITATTDLASLADADLFIEAVFEDLSVKQALMRRVDGLARPGAILATNTSYLDVDLIAAATTRPADVVGRATGGPWPYRRHARQVARRNRIFQPEPSIGNARRGGALKMGRAPHIMAASAPDRGHARFAIIRPYCGAADGLLIGTA